MDLIFPLKCPACGEKGLPTTGFCRKCYSSLCINPSWRCPVCGLAFNGASGHCCSAGDDYFLDGLIAVADYEADIRNIIQCFKYERHSPTGRAIGEALADAVKNFLDIPCDAVVPVPLGKSRQKKRGFNQSALLARRIGRSLSLPVYYRLLKRIRETQSQAELSPAQRRKNVSGAFGLSRKYTIDRGCILLVDDVYTTGSTMNECARVLKKAGTFTVFGIAFACASIKTCSYKA